MSRNNIIYLSSGKAGQTEYHPLIDSLENAILCSAEPELREMLTREKEKALKQIGWDPYNKIKVTSRGQFKTSTPFQKCCKDRNAVIDYAYSYFFSNTSEMTVMECFEKGMQKFELAAKQDARSLETAAIYRQSFRKFFVDYPANIAGESQINYSLGTMKIKNVSNVVLHAYLEALTIDFHLSRAGLRNAKTALNKAFIYACNVGIIPLNTLKGIDTSDILTFNEKVGKIKAYTKDEIIRLLNVMTDEKVLSSYRQGTDVREAAAALCFETQLSVRAGETRNLKWSDIVNDDGQTAVNIHSFIRRSRDENEKRIFVERSVTKAKSRLGDRTPHLSDFAKEILWQQKSRHPFEEYIFTHNGKPLHEGSLREWLQKFCAIAGVEYKRPHCLRASAVTNMHEAGIGINRIQHSSGHLDPQTTGGYIDASRSKEITTEEANVIFPTPSNFATTCYQSLLTEEKTGTL